MALTVANFRADFAAIVTDFGETVTWARTSETEGEMGRASASSSSLSESESMVIQPITEKDRDILGAGVQVKGHMKAYAKHEYDLSGGGTDTPTVGDTITRAGGQIYLVEKVMGKHTANGEVFRKLILREIDNG